MAGNNGWIREVDIRKLFDTLDHGRLRDLLRHRIRDGVLLRLIDKWLKVGVMEGGSVSYPTTGSPQGGVISPLLANIYLHYALDQWFDQDVKPRLHGPAWMVRYADDFVMGFSREADARRVVDVLPKRFGKFGLTIHRDKTRLVPFQRPHPRSSGKDGSSAGPGTFDFLGFTHYWGRSRRGTWVVKRKTAADRFRRAVQAVSAYCRRHRHDAVGEQHRKLNQKLQGHYAYYGVIGNGCRPDAFRQLVLRIWRYWLNRRNRERTLTWDIMCQLLKHYPLARARIVHQPQSCSESST
jgi:group II intron reverse transcriptase/maturase